MSDQSKNNKVKKVENIIFLKCGSFEATEKLHSVLAKYTPLKCNINIEIENSL